jgi:hypothetical protein
MVSRHEIDGEDECCLFSELAILLSGFRMCRCLLVASLLEGIVGKIVTPVLQVKVDGCLGMPEPKRGGAH